MSEEVQLVPIEREERVMKVQDPNEARKKNLEKAREKKREDYSKSSNRKKDITVEETAVVKEVDPEVLVQRSHAVVNVDLNENREAGEIPTLGQRIYKHCTTFLGNFTFNIIGAMGGAIIMGWASTLLNPKPDNDANSNTRGDEQRPIDRNYNGVTVFK